MDGWIFLDKPLGITSTQALGRLKRILRVKKAGHGGTLDPLATGLLPIAVGEATKLISYVFDSLKTYEFTVGWGKETTTGDQEGEGLYFSENRPSEEEIRSILPSFEGTLLQVPPLYSALKVEGKRAYTLAREGRVQELPPRPVFIESLVFLGGEGKDRAHFRVSCGKGTYIRSLARDISRKLGAFGSLERLRRVRIGKFLVEDAISLDNLEKSGKSRGGHSVLMPMGAVLDDIPAVSLCEPFIKRLRQGQKISLKKENPRVFYPSLEEEIPLSKVVLKAEEGTLIGMGRWDGCLLIPERIFNIETGKDTIDVDYTGT